MMGGWIPFWGVENLIVEDREVESKAKTDWMSGSKFCASITRSCLKIKETQTGQTD